MCIKPRVAVCRLFEYLERFTTTYFSDERDMIKDLRNLRARNNTLIRKFKHCMTDVKVNSFKTHCYAMSVDSNGAILDRPHYTNNSNV